mmetsp:Transcript_33187/g.86774  ORF Transcript_33187/g.86774 Transcript_33187/m.86774 type:complete len:205 (+) Transcript_33187:2068-2682(+)
MVRSRFNEKQCAGRVFVDPRPALQVERGGVDHRFDVPGRSGGFKRSEGLAERGARMSLVCCAFGAAVGCLPLPPHPLVEPGLRRPPRRGPGVTDGGHPRQIDHRSHKGVLVVGWAHLSGGPVAHAPAIPGLCRIIVRFTVGLGLGAHRAVADHAIPFADSPERNSQVDRRGLGSRPLWSAGAGGCRGGHCPQQRVGAEITTRQQ